jgi:hypothetical protein
MTPGYIMFQLPFALSSLNVRDRQHWAVRQKKKAKLAMEVLVAIGGPACKPVKPVQKATIMVKRYSAGTLDQDNLTASVKPLLDILCRSSSTHPHGMGFIEDDSPAHIELIVNQEKCKRGTGSTVVSIMPIGNE